MRSLGSRSTYEAGKADDDSADQADDEEPAGDLAHWQDGYAAPDSGAMASPISVIRQSVIGPRQFVVGNEACRRYIKARRNRSMGVGDIRTLPPD